MYAPGGAGLAPGQSLRLVSSSRSAGPLGLILLVLGACAGLVFAGSATASAAAPPDQLVMFEQVACPFCATWNDKVGRIYDRTDEAKVVPLRRVDIHATRPADLRNVRGVYFTPTFVVMHCGHEFGRITGYISDDQFWGLLDQSLRSIKESPACSR